MTLTMKMKEHYPYLYHTNQTMLQSEALILICKYSIVIEPS